MGNKCDNVCDSCGNNFPRQASSGMTAWTKLSVSSVPSVPFEKAAASKLMLALPSGPAATAVGTADGLPSVPCERLPLLEPAASSKLTSTLPGEPKAAADDLRSM